MILTLKDVLETEKYKNSAYKKYIDCDKNNIEIEKLNNNVPVLFFDELNDGGLLIQLWICNNIPDGWKIDKGAMTAPKGFCWITNGKSRFGTERKSALLKL